MNRNAQFICYFTLISCVGVFTETIISDTSITIHSRKQPEEPSTDLKVIGLSSSTKSPPPTTIAAQSSALPQAGQVTPPPLILPAAVAQNVQNVASLLQSIQKQQLAQISDQVNFNSEKDEATVPPTTIAPASTSATTVKSDKRSRRSTDGESFSGLSSDDVSENAGEVVEETATGTDQYSEYFEPPSAVSYSEYN